MKCARTACDNSGRHKHTENGQFYCTRCARKINEYSPRLVEWPDKDMVAELRNLCRTNVLRTDEESQQVAARKQEILLAFKAQYPEDVFDRFSGFQQSS